MTNFRNLVAVSATVAAVAIGQNVHSQDDLNDLLKDLESEPAAEAKAQVENAVKEASAAEEKVEEAVAEAKEEVAEAEEKVEEAVAEAKEEVAAAEEKVEEAVAEVKEEVAAAEPAAESVAEEKVEEAAAEAKEEVAEAEPAAEPVAEEVAEEKAEEVAAAEPAAEPVAEEKAEEAVVETKPVQPAAVTAFDPKDAELIAELKATAEIQRKAFDQQADREIEEARKSFADGEYLEAVKHYELARKYIYDRPAKRGLMKECDEGMAQGLYLAALEEEKIGRYDRAVKLMAKAVDMRNPKARRELERMKAAGDPEEKKVDVSEYKSRRNEEDYKKKRAEINMHLKRSRQLLSTSELDRALDECELVLLQDPYNKDAIRIRNVIEKKRHTVMMKEREATREGMMADVDKAWRPVYAVDARELAQVQSTTLASPLQNDPERLQEQLIVKRMKEMRLPAISFKPPATIIDAVEFFRDASRDYDRPDLPLEQRGFNFVLKTPELIRTQQVAENEGFGAGDEDESASGAPAGIPVIPMITASDITFYEALKQVCELVGYKFKVQGSIVMVMQKDMTIDEMVTRSYPVVAEFLGRIGSASSEMKEMKSNGFGGGSKSDDDGEENQERDWKEFFGMLGVKWPEGSSIMYIKSIGKLRVKNTYENLAELEKALTEMNADPKLIEIETRFVEVCQEDLNSLGFEWILNSDFTLGVGNKIGKALGIAKGKWGQETSTYSKNDGWTRDSSYTVDRLSNNGGGTSTLSTDRSIDTDTSSESFARTSTTLKGSNGSSWSKYGRRRALGINGIGGDSDFTTGNRYLSTLSNHISGEGYSTNDQFMKVNAFLGGADLSMILHMLSQRSDTDLLSAPKVLTRPGEEAVMKVVTEYIYPTDYDVQLQSSSSGSGNNSGSSQSAILAVVEPQSFTMREVGVILDVTPTLTDDGNLIDLKLNTQIVDEPTWKNYGMRIPFTGNSSLQSFTGLGEIFTGLSSIFATLGSAISDTVKESLALQATDAAQNALNELTSTSMDNMTYYDAPMEQPFFHVRSVDSSISVYPGATIVMGGLITEQRRAMDDKIPFLGDLPFIGRLFRSHSEQTNKRNLLIFVTTRLVDVRGREVTLGSMDMKDDANVKAAPEVNE